MDVKQLKKQFEDQEDVTEFSPSELWVSCEYDYN